MLGKNRVLVLNDIITIDYLNIQYLKDDTDVSMKTLIKWRNDAYVKLIERCKYYDRYRHLPKN